MSHANCCLLSCDVKTVYAGHLPIPASYIVIVLRLQDVCYTLRQCFHSDSQLAGFVFCHGRGHGSLRLPVVPTTVAMTASFGIAHTHVLVPLPEVVVGTDRHQLTF